MKKSSLLFALLCVSVMGWAAIDQNTNFWGDHNFQWQKISEYDTPAEVRHVESHGGFDCLYITFVDAAFNRDYIVGGTVFTDAGAQAWLKLESYTDMYTDVLFYEAGSTTNVRWGLRIYNPAGTPASACASNHLPVVSGVTAASGITYNSAQVTITASDEDGDEITYVVKDGSTIVGSSSTSTVNITGLTAGTTYNSLKAYAVDACGTSEDNANNTIASFTTLTRPSECIGAKGQWDNPADKKVYYQIDYADNKVIFNLRSLTGYGLDFAEVHIAGTGGGNYVMTADGNGGYTYTINNPTANNEWYIRFLFSDTNFGGNWMTAQNVNSSDPNVIYYKVGECTFTETENVNIALATAGSSATASSGTAANAIDNNEGSRWESDFEDPQWICVDFGARKVFNKVQLLHQTAYIKSFQIQVSDDGTNFITIKNVSETLTDFDGDKKLQNIDLGGKFAARYLRIYGTERGTQWGYCLYELRVMYATDPVLTTYTLSIPSSFCTVGSDYPLTLTAKDQLGNDFSVATTYTVTPVGAGSVDAGVYTPLLQGTATITAEGGGKSSSVTVRNEVSANLALNQPAAAGHSADVAFSADKANNTNTKDRWASGGTAVHYNAGENPNFEDWWYVDLGAKYDISEIAIKWETARPNDYDIRVSDDATSWTNIGVFDSYPASNGDNSSNYEYYNSLSAIPGRYVGVWARDGYGDYSLQYGISMYDFQVFGTENVSANKFVSAIASPAAGGSVTVQAGGVDVTEVPNNTEVTFTATPNEGYDFVNWTNSGVEVSTSATYVATITASTSLMANFEIHRTAYCGAPITDPTWSTTLYLTITNPSANTYKILVEGSADNKIESAYDNFNFALTHVNGEPGTTTFPAASWTVDNTGYGSAYITFTAADFRDVTYDNAGSKYVVFNKQGGGLAEFRAFPDVTLINWDATCVDDEAPVLAAPVATPLSGTSVRLALSATDNMSALLTYHINYKPTGDAGAGTDVDVPGTAGETTYHNIKGLTGGTNYTFSVTVSDAVPNTSAAQTCSATPAMATAPVPTREAVTVLSVYSDAYTSALAHDFIKNNWAGPTYAEQDLGGDHLLVYTSDPAIQEQMPDVAWGTNNDGDDAIIAKDGYNDGTNKGLDVRSMVYLHFDMWSAIATIYPEVYLNDDKLAGFELDGSGWQSFDIPLSSLTAEQKNNVRFIKFIALRTPNPEEIAIDNVYFWTDAAPTYTRNDSWMAPGELGTVCYPEGLRVAGATMYQMAGTDANGKFVFDEVEVLAPGVPYLFEAQSNELRFYATAATPAAEAGTSNGMVGTFTEITIPQNSPNIYYFTGTKFYAVTARSTDLTVPANRAYVDLTTPHPAMAPKPGIRRITFDVEGTSTITGCEQIDATDAPAKILIDGQMYILRGEKLYDATGRLVK